MKKENQTAITVDALTARIKRIEQERDQFVSQANQQIAAMNGAINELQSLIAESEEEAAA